MTSFWLWCIFCILCWFVLAQVPVIINQLVKIAHKD